jgi:pimeloyl-ACP methyl ester carboxylesterase
MGPLRQLVRRIVLAISITAAVCACASADPTAVTGKFSIGGRSLYLDCHGSGSPTVVMDAGLGNTHATWSAVAPAVSKLARVCTYDRANLGSSDATTKPRSSADIVSDLHALLKSASISPPYLLVGHSLGGMDMRLFASDFATEVAGIVLVDPTPTAFVDEECAVVTASECSALRSGWSDNPEGIDNVKNGQEITQTGPLPTVPMTVLAATTHGQAVITEPATQAQIEVFWQRDQAALVASMPQAKLEVIPSGHDIQLLHPDAVIGALTEMIAALRVAAPT